MMIPSMSVMLVGLALTAALMAIDWYVWGTTYRAAFRLPNRVTPMAVAGMLDPFLGRLIAANQTILPKAVVDSCNAKLAAGRAHDGDEFKKVA